jgi:hypothetical protein
VSVFVVILIVDDVFYYFVHRSDLIVLRSNVDSRSTVTVFVENWEFIELVCFEKIVVLFAEKMKKTSGIKSEIWNHTFDTKFKINFEKDKWRRLHSYQLGDLRRCLARIQTLNQHELSKSDLMYFDLINVLEFGLIIKCLILILDANLSVVIVLARKQDVLLWLNLQVVAASKRMNLSFEAFWVLDNSCFFISDSNNINTLI